MGNVKIYANGRMTFILTDTKTIVRTSLPQTFVLIPKAHYFNRRLNMIRTMIAIDEIRSFDELARWCRPGIDWVTTNSVDNIKVEV